MADMTTPAELQEVKNLFKIIIKSIKCMSTFLQGLDVIESTNLKYFNKEMIAEFFALKGTYLAKIGRLGR